MRFEDRVAVVTGAASGIGYETAALLLAEGARVFAADLEPSGVPEGCDPIQVDVSDEASVARMIEIAGDVDVLVNNAGIGSTSDPVSATPEEWDKVFSVNARGVFLGTRAALPGMLERGSGCIVNTASVAGLIGLANRAVYCASKGAVVAFTKAVAVQYAGTGVRCNCVCPGTVGSPWVQRLLDEAPDPEAAKAALIARQPLGRLGEPAEVARAIAYLASDDAAFVTGEALVIDGGIMAGLGPATSR